MRPGKVTANRIVGAVVVYVLCAPIRVPFCSDRTVLTWRFHSGASAVYVYLDGLALFLSLNDNAQFAGPERHYASTSLRSFAGNVGGIARPDVHNRFAGAPCLAGSRRPDSEYAIVGWIIAPFGLRRVVNDAVALHFRDPDAAAAFVARWCVRPRPEAPLSLPAPPRSGAGDFGYCSRAIPSAAPKRLRAIERVAVFAVHRRVVRAGQQQPVAVVALVLRPVLEQDLADLLVVRVVAHAAGEQRQALRQRFRVGAAVDIGLRPVAALSAPLSASTAASIRSRICSRRQLVGAGRGARP